MVMTEVMTPRGEKNVIRCEQKKFEWEQRPADSPEIVAAPSPTSRYQATDEDLAEWFFCERPRAQQ
jgi:hypothetical protein